MSVIATAWAWDQRVEHSGAKLLLLKLADQANDDWLCWPSRATIAAHCECDISSVKRRIQILVELGLVDVIPRFKDGRQTSNLYRLTGGAQPHPRGRTAEPLGGRVAVTPPGGASADPAEPPEEPSEEPGAARPRDAIWDALVVLFGEPSHRNARGKRNKVVSLLREAGAEPDEIRHRAAAYLQLFPGAVLTDTALANQWDALSSRSSKTLSAEERAAVQRVRDEEARRERELADADGVPMPAEAREALERLGVLPKEEQ